MKRIILWIREEKIILLFTLLAIGIVLHGLPNFVMIGAMFIYATIILAILNLIHKLYIKYK